MLKVKLNGATNEVELHFKYNSDYINRIRKLSHAKYLKDRKVWVIPRLILDDLEDLFPGELMYITPKWVIDPESPKPDYSKIYSKIRNYEAELKPPYKPYPFQSFGSNFLVHSALEYGFGCLFDDCGTGKTLMSIYAALILDKEVGLLKHTIPILVVAKSGLKYQWVSDGVDKFTSATSIIIDGTKAKRKKQYDYIKKNPGAYEYVIMGYETLREDADIISKVDVGLVISDEAHKVKNRTTKLNKSMRPLNAQYFFFLTGTPISKDPSDIYGLASIGNGKYFGSWKDFIAEYATAIRTQYGIDYFYRNLDKLNNKINDIAIRRTEQEIDMQMPKIIESEVRLKPTKCQREIDQKLLEDLQKSIDDLADLSSRPTTPENTEKMTKIKGSLKGVIALRVGCADSPELFKHSSSASVVKKYGSLSDNQSPKIDYLKEHVAEIVSSGNKVVVFTKFETMTRIIERELSKITDCVLFTGKMNAKEKEDARLKFKTDTNCNAFIATNAGAEGINLQEAKYLVNFDLDWDRGINDQRNKRIRRLDSQFDRVFVYNYIVEDTADEMILKVLSDKQDLFDYLVNNNDEQSKQMKDAMKSFN